MKKKHSSDRELTALIITSVIASKLLLWITVLYLLTKEEPFDVFKPEIKAASRCYSWMETRDYINSVRING